MTVQSRSQTKLDFRIPPHLLEQFKPWISVTELGSFVKNYDNKQVIFKFESSSFVTSLPEIAQCHGGRCVAAWPSSVLVGRVQQSDVCAYPLVLALADRKWKTDSSWPRLSSSVRPLSSRRKQRRGWRHRGNNVNRHKASRAWLDGICLLYTSPSPRD